MNKEFELQVDALVKACQARGVKMVPYSGLRTLKEQAKLWRRSRSTKLVNEKIKELKRLKAFASAKALADVGPQSPAPWASNAPPGFSWHNWGLAADFYWDVDGVAVWDDEGVGYRVLREEATKLGLRSLWPLESGHIQQPQGGSPSIEDVVKHFK